MTDSHTSESEATGSHISESEVTSICTSESSENSEYRAWRETRSKMRRESVWREWVTLEPTPFEINNLEWTESKVDLSNGQRTTKSHYNTPESRTIRVEWLWSVKQLSEWCVAKQDDWKFHFDSTFKSPVLVKKEWKNTRPEVLISRDGTKLFLIRKLDGYYYHMYRMNSDGHMGQKHEVDEFGLDSKWAERIMSAPGDCLVVEWQAYRFVSKSGTPAWSIPLDVWP